MREVSARPIVPPSIVHAFHSDAPEVLLRVKIPAVLKQHLDRMARHHFRRPEQELAIALRAYLIQEYVAAFYGLDSFGDPLYPPDAEGHRHRRR